MSSNSESSGWILEAVDLYELPLSRYARRLLGDVDLAADAVQHAFVKLCEESQHGLEGRIAPWLFRVCRNRAIDHLRRAGREQTLLDAAAGGSPGDVHPGTIHSGDVHSGGLQPGSREPDPAVSAERADLARRLRLLLADLPAPQRETIDLWCEGLTYRQIAEVTGRQEGHVRVLAHRGLAALRNHPLVRGLISPCEPVARGVAFHANPTPAGKRP